MHQPGQLMSPDDLHQLEQRCINEPDRLEAADLQQLIWGRLEAVRDLGLQPQSAIS